MRPFSTGIESCVARQGRADVRGHVVGAFDGVPVEPIVLGHHAAEEYVQIVS